MPKLNAYTKCSACKTLYRDEYKGCEICGPAKDNIETPGGSDVINAGRQALAMLESQMDDLRFEKHRARTGPEKTVGRFDRALMKAELDCAKALSILLEHLRKQEKREAVEADQLSPEEKLEVFLDMVETLPPRLLPYLEAGLKARQLFVTTAPAPILLPQRE